MFKSMRKKERELAQEESIEILAHGEYGVLSTISFNGYPYGVPLSYVYTNEAVYVHCAKEGHKLENLQRDARVSFCVVKDVEVLPAKFSTKYKSVILFGTAAEVSGAEKEEALLALIEKYSSQFIPEGKQYIQKAGAATQVLKITIEHMTGKARK